MHMTPQHLIDYVEVVQQGMIVSLDNIQWHLKQFKDTEIKWLSAELSGQFSDFLTKLNEIKNELSRQNQ